MFKNVLVKNEKENHQKDASHLKSNKNSSQSKIYKEDIEKGEKWKRRVCEKFNNVLMRINFFTFIFLYMEKVLGNCSSY